MSDFLVTERQARINKGIRWFLTSRWLPITGLLSLNFAFHPKHSGSCEIVQIVSRSFHGAQCSSARGPGNMGDGLRELTEITAENLRIRHAVSPTKGKSAARMIGSWSPCHSSIANFWNVFRLTRT